jgi:hypothetical protein
VSFHGGPWFDPNPHRPDGGVGTATGPDADLPDLGHTASKTATFTYTFRGSPIPIMTDLPAPPHTYLAHRVEAALAVAGAAELVLGRRWPLADLAATAVREAMLGQLRPGPDSELYVLPDCAPFAHERVVTALQFLLDADRSLRRGQQPQPRRHPADLRRQRRRAGRHHTRGEPAVPARHTVTDHRADTRRGVRRTPPSERSGGRHRPRPRSTTADTPTRDRHSATAKESPGGCRVIRPEHLCRDVRRGTGRGR